MSHADAGRLGYAASAESLARVASERHEAVVANRQSDRCYGCGKPIPFEQRRNKFCGSACSARKNNGTRRTVRDVTQRPCAHCATPFKPSNKTSTMCSKACVIAAMFDRNVAAWLSGRHPGGTWHGVAPFVKRWLIQRDGERCGKCGWSERHQRTGLVPIQVDHINGDPDNHAPTNLRLLCPNCHSLTHTFGALNRGRGRAARYARRSSSMVEPTLGKGETSVQS